MRKILLSGFFLFMGTGLAWGQRIPLEVSFGVGGYFPHDGRYTHFFDHNPANFSGQVTYKWSVLDFKAGFEHMRKRTSTAEADTQGTFFISADVDSQKRSYTSTSVQSYLRASGFRFGAALHLFREAAFSPFVGFGGSFGSSRGHGDSVKVGTDTVFNYRDTSTIQNPDTMVYITQTPPSQVPEFSESFSGFYLEAGVHTRLPYNFFFVFEAIRDFRSNNKPGVIGPAKGGGTLIGMRLGYRF